MVIYVKNVTDIYGSIKKPGKCSIEEFGKGFKGLVHPKIKFCSLFIHPQEVPNIYASFSCSFGIEEVWPTTSPVACVNLSLRLLLDKAIMKCAVIKQNELVRSRENEFFDGVPQGADHSTSPQLLSECKMTRKSPVVWAWYILLERDQKCADVCELSFSLCGLCWLWADGRKDPQGSRSVGFTAERAGPSESLFLLVVIMKETDSSHTPQPGTPGHCPKCPPSSESEPAKQRMRRQWCRKGNNRSLKSSGADLFWNAVESGHVCTFGAPVQF